MPLLKYTTEVPAAKSAAEIEAILSYHGATAVLKEYEGGQLKAINFKAKTVNGDIPFRLPLRPEAVEKILAKQYSRELTAEREKALKERAIRVAMRIVKTWIEARMALIDLEMVKMEEVFLPYMLVGDGKKTLYERLEGQQFMLNPGKEWK